MIETDRDKIDAAFNRFYADISRYTSQLHDEQNRLAPWTATFIWKDFNANVEKFVGSLRSFRAGLAALEDGIAQKRDELAVATNDLGKAQAKLEELVKQTREKSKELERIGA
jgi:chromosome segregation ATPase